MTLGILKRDWYLIPAFPALDIVAAVGLVQVWDWAYRRWGSQLERSVSPSAIRCGSLLAAIGLQLWAVIPSHPYYYTYWNPLVLGSNWAPQAVMVGWDVDLSAGAHYLNNKHSSTALQVATRSTRGFRQIFNGHTIRWVTGEPWIQADYLVIRRNHLQMGKIAPSILTYVSHRKVDHVVKIGGVDYLWIYEGPAAEYFAGPSPLAGKATLLGYDMGNRTLLAGDELPVTLYWQHEGMSSNDTIFLRLVDANGYVWAEAVAEPRPGFEEAAVSHDQIVEGQATLLVPVGTPPGTYMLHSGIYSSIEREVLGYFSLPASGDKVAVGKPSTPGSGEQLLVENKVDVRLVPEVTLLGFGLPGRTLLLAEDNWLDLYWQANTDVDRDYAVGLQLLDADGKEIAYWLGRPVMSIYPTYQWVTGEIVHDPWRLEVPVDVPAGEYLLKLTLFDAETQSKVGQVVLGNVSVEKRLRTFDIPAMQNPVNVTLGHRITLLGYDLSIEPTASGGRLIVRVYWQGQEALHNSYVASVRLLSPDGDIVAQHDGVPACGESPTDSWVAGEIVTDEHVLQFSKPKPGEYRIVASVYDQISGDRLVTTDDHSFVILQSLLVD
jgi:hypothetical protein